MKKHSIDDRINETVELIRTCGGFDGEHHKQWVLDQVLRNLLQDTYESVIAEWNAETDEDGELYSPWDEGVAP